MGLGKLSLTFIAVLTVGLALVGCSSPQSVAEFKVDLAKQEFLACQEWVPFASFAATAITIEEIESRAAIVVPVLELNDSLMALKALNAIDQELTTFRTYWTEGRNDSVNEAKLHRHLDNVQKLRGECSALGFSGG